MNKMGQFKVSMFVVDCFGRTSTDDFKRGLSHSQAVRLANRMNEKLSDVDEAPESAQSILTYIVKPI
jgi:hypothetical protein